MPSRIASSTRFAFVSEIRFAVTWIMRRWFSRLIVTGPSPLRNDAKLETLIFPFVPFT